MEDYDNNILDAINDIMFNLIERFNNKIPIDILGKIVKDFLLEEKKFIVIDKKRVSPNKYIKKFHQTFSSFINKRTNYKIINSDGRIYITL